MEGDRRMFNCKLYKTYYPIISDNDKDIFISNNLTKIHRLLKEETVLNMYKRIDIDKEYGKRIKKEWSVFGNPKFGNVVLNKHIEQEREHDFRLKKIGKNNEVLERLQEGLFYNSLTVDDVNIILCLVNKRFRYNIGLLLTAVIVGAVLLIIFK